MSISGPSLAVRLSELRLDDHCSEIYVQRSDPVAERAKVDAEEEHIWKSCSVSPQSYLLDICTAILEEQNGFDCDGLEGLFETESELFYHLRINSMKGFRRFLRQYPEKFYLFKATPHQYTIFLKIYWKEHSHDFYGPKLIVPDDDISAPNPYLRLFVDGIPLQATICQLRSHFLKYGPLCECYLPYPDRSRSSIRGFVTFRTREGLDSALGHTHRVTYQNLSLEENQCSYREIQLERKYYASENRVIEGFTKLLTDSGGIAPLRLFFDHYSNLSAGQRKIIGSRKQMVPFLEQYVDLFQLSAVQENGPYCKVTLLSSTPRGETIVARNIKNNEGIAKSIADVYLEFLETCQHKCVEIRCLSSSFGQLTITQQMLLNRSIGALECLFKHFPELFRLSGTGLDCVVSLVD